MTLQERLKELREDTGEDRLTNYELGCLDALSRPIEPLGARAWYVHDFVRRYGVCPKDEEVLLKLEPLDFMSKYEREKLEHYVNWLEVTTRRERWNRRKYDDGFKHRVPILVAAANAETKPEIVQREIQCDFALES